MKRLLFLGVGTALIVTMGGIGSAQADSVGGPHNITIGTTSTAGSTNYVISNSALGAAQCAGCHRAHTAQGQYLTKDAQPQLCYNCHDGTVSSLDVKTGTDDGTTNRNGAGGALRGGGFDSARIGSSLASKDLGSPGPYGPITTNQNIPVLAAGLPVTSMHQINGTTSGTMWGNGTTGVGQTAVTLECGACHDPHGNGNYRLLKPSPDGQQYITSLPGATPVTMSAKTTVNIPDQPQSRDASGNFTGTKAYTTTNYWDVQAVGVPLTADEQAEKAGTVTDGFLGGISAWCTTCHTRYLSGSGGGTTATTDPVFTYKHRSDEQASNKPNCIQCHVAHGTNASMSSYAGAVTAPGGTVTSTATTNYYQNSSLLRVDNRGTCLMCHAVGSPTP